MTHKFGLLCGRFQPVHKGHIELIRKSLEHCDKLIIAIGSAQESRTKHNPFSFEERKKMLQRCLRGMGKRVIIIPVDDREQIKNDTLWGQYLINEVMVKTGVCPTINFSGNEVIRSHWFDNVGIEQMFFDRNEMPVSATGLRNVILDDDFNTFTLMAPNGLWIKFRWLKKILEEVHEERI